MGCDDKRSKKRYMVRIIANCSKNREKVNAIAFTKDISQQGARLVTTKDIKAGEHISLSLEVPTCFIPLIVFAEVIWQRKMGEEKVINKENLELGVRFLRMGSFDKEKLEQFLTQKQNILSMIN